MASIGITAKDFSGCKQTDRRFFGEHGPNLDRRGVCPQKLARVKIKRIVHLPRRVIFGDVKGFKVIVFVFDVGSGFGGKAMHEAI